mmetsp:Transcript_53370/g.104386  ORF Transcript_53370/g.104386 Transcript_53370/m.104386 type:complete len:134 (-) Transcript_53370:139-540(-)
MPRRHAGVLKKRKAGSKFKTRLLELKFGNESVCNYLFKKNEKVHANMVLEQKVKSSIDVFCSSNGEWQTGSPWSACLKVTLSGVERKTGSLDTEELTISAPVCVCMRIATILGGILQNESVIQCAIDVAWIHC